MVVVFERDSLSLSDEKKECSCLYFNKSMNEEKQMKEIGNDKKTENVCTKLQE